MLGCDGDFEKILIDEYTIKDIVKSLAIKIKQDYKDCKDNLFIISVLKGAYFFTSDLLRTFFPELDPVVEFVQISSYGAGHESSGKLEFKKGLEDANLFGKDVLIVEDIIDTGLTISKLKEYLFEKGAKSVKICVLLDKKAAHKTDIEIDYVGKSIPNEFVVGYGLDYNEKYRNFPCVAVLKKEVYS